VDELRKAGSFKDAWRYGIHGFNCFNKVLLAKQRWRLMQNTDSITSKILMAKYYFGGTILKTHIENRPSFAWRSIHGVYDLVKRPGLILKHY
jgi:hypothetical protein